MSTYLWLMLSGSIIIFALFGLRCAKAVRQPVLRERAWETALLSFILSAVFGTVLARVGYALLKQELDFEYDGIAALEDLLRIDYDNLSFFFGGVGAVLGVLLAIPVAAILSFIYSDYFLPRQQARYNQQNQEPAPDDSK